jgi:hypothetical protein
VLLCFFRIFKDTATALIFIRIFVMSGINKNTTTIKLRLRYERAELKGRTAKRLAVRAIYAVQIK